MLMTDDENIKVTASFLLFQDFRSQKDHSRTRIQVEHLQFARTIENAQGTCAKMANEVRILRKFRSDFITAGEIS